MAMSNKKPSSRQPLRASAKPAAARRSPMMLRLRMPHPFYVLTLPQTRASRLVRIRPYRVPSNEELLHSG